MKKTDKILSCRRPENDMVATEKLSKDTMSSLGFVRADKTPKKKSVAIPFCIATDGRSVVALANRLGNVDIGFAVAVTKPRFGPYLKSGYERLIADRIATSFLSMYEGAQVKEREDSRPLGRDDFHVIDSGHATCSMDTQQVFPIYFIHLNPESTINLPAKIEGVAALSLDKHYLVDPTVLVRMPVISKEASILIGMEQIPLPDSEVERKGFWP